MRVTDDSTVEEAILEKDIFVFDRSLSVKHCNIIIAGTRDDAHMNVGIAEKGITELLLQTAMKLNFVRSENCVAYFEELSSSRAEFIDAL